MQYTTRTNNYSTSDSSFQREHSPNQFNLFNSLRALDNIQFKTPLEDFHATLPDYWVADSVAPVFDPASSVAWPPPDSQLTGQLKQPGATPHHSWDWNDSYFQYPNSSPPPVPQDSYVVPQDWNIPSIGYNDSYIGYSNPSSHSTRQELNVNLHFDSCTSLHENHIEMGPSNYDVPCADVMQHIQEPGNLNASGSYYQYAPNQQQPEFGTPLQVSDLQYTHFAQEIQPIFYEYEHSISPPVLATSLSPLSTSPPDLTTPHPNYVSSPSFLPPSNLTALFISPNLVSAIRSSPPTSQPVHVLPAPPMAKPLKKKRTHKPRKATSIKATSTKASEAKCPKRRDLPNGRSSVKSLQWLNEHLPHKRPCKLCQRGPADGRHDRALEHLTSTHILQVVKNIKTFDPNCFGISNGNLIETPAQFAFTRQYVEALKCPFCEMENNLVIRNEVFREHLNNVHEDLPESTRREEMERLEKLILPKKGYYSFQDEFLYKFFHVK